MRQICAEAEAYLKSEGRAVARRGGAAVRARRADHRGHGGRRLPDDRASSTPPLIVVATDSGRTALALSNRRPAATILALPAPSRSRGAWPLLGRDAGGARRTNHGGTRLAVRHRVGQIPRPRRGRASTRCCSPIRSRIGPISARSWQDWSAEREVGRPGVPSPYLPAACSSLIFFSAPSRMRCLNSAVALVSVASMSMVFCAYFRASSLLPIARYASERLS